MTPPSLHDRIAGCFAGVALGDALGMPWETCTRGEILELTGGQGVTRLQGLPAHHPRKHGDTRGLHPGETTDDWQLTHAVATSLMRCQGFHLVDQAAAHIEAYETSTSGWGGSTRDAVASIKRWFDTRGRDGRRPDLPAPPAPNRGKGNGVLMKLAPLACHAALVRDRQGPDALDDRELRQQIRALGRMSHHEEVSSDVGSVLLAILEDRLSPPGPVPLLRLIEEPGLASTLHRLFLGGEAGRLPSADETRDGCGTSFLASESAAFCLATMLRHPDDFSAAVLEAVNAGGDTDTNAAIVGALIGARVGASGLPVAWVHAVREAPRALAFAAEFTQTLG